ncbi:NrfD/PsrC family molybdoenzyme membrane anchor subunit [Streptomyces sp. SID8014]|uniref:NrfD/PsrC family molybdoenzyme membrane anchor subunit n=1 Tax=Streptomyces sp. SID8014 TaxID=2706097 RepID=UPI001EF21093|nr:NrfD/PsrC family molybdoenzyme membrane anchor subunit [Streptomyces sp. SID8014]
MTREKDRRRDGRHGKRRRGEELMVEPAEFATYYDRPVLKPPSWRATDIAGYFFLGGLAGAGSVFAAGAQATGRCRTATGLKITSLGAISLSTAALIHDLGRPGRFANMLRVFKPTSPMNMGSWLLSAYGPAAGVSAASAVTGLLPRVGTAATWGAAALGPLVATYTAVLAADTAVPAWHEGHRELPYVFAASAAAAASGAALLVGPPQETGPARSATVLAAAGELAALRAMRRRLGPTAETHRSGRAARFFRAAEALHATGAVLAATPAVRRRPVAALTGLALLTASACTRFAVFHSGVVSAEDPLYTIRPQRERLVREAEASSAQH